MSADEGKMSKAIDNRLDALFGEDEVPQSPKKSNSSNQVMTEVDSRLDALFGDEDIQTKTVVSKPAEQSAKTPAKPKAQTKKSPNAEAERDSGLVGPLAELKSIILSLEWEITDQGMQKLNEEVQKLEKKYKEDKIVSSFIQLISSLGKYIQKKKADSHPDSVSLLNSVFKNLDKVASPNNNLTDAMKKKVLADELDKYKKLKDDIASNKADKAEKSRKAVFKAAQVSSHPPVMFDTDAPSSEKYDNKFDNKYDSASLKEEAPPILRQASSELQQAGQNMNLDSVTKALIELNKTIKEELQALRKEIKLIRQER